jgi:hypothetical protein
METFEVGSVVTCGICGKETKVQFVTDREGGKAFDLECMHRNTLCPNCDVLVRDDSDTIQKVEPLCKACNPEAFADEDEDDLAAAV